MKKVIVIPTYNEAENIGVLIGRIIALNIKDLQIIIIDDDSQDGTRGILKKLSKKYPISYFIRKNKRGYGSALKFGLEKAKNFDVIITMDGDLSHNPKEIPRMINKIKYGYEMVIGSRYVPGGKTTNWPILRKLTSRITNLFVRTMLSTGIKDNTSGYRAYSGRIIRKILNNLNSEGYSILEEILFLVKKEKSKIAEIPITFDNRKAGKSKAKMIKEMGGLLQTMLRLKWRGVRRFLEYCVVGVSGIVVNEGLLWLLTEWGGWHFIISGAIAIELSILSNFVFNDLWAFNDRRSGNYFFRMLKFNFSRILTGILNLGILWGLTQIGLNYLLSNLIGIAVAMIFGFTLCLRWVWK
jgi:dolichol-phosphate mannosyltransferase